MNSPLSIGTLWSPVDRLDLVEALAEAAAISKQAGAGRVAIGRMPLRLRVFAGREYLSPDATSKVLVKVARICTRLGFSQAQEIAAKMEPCQPIVRDKMELAVVHTMTCRLDADAVLAAVAGAAGRSESLESVYSEFVQAFDAGWALGAAMFCNGVGVKKTPLPTLTEEEVWVLTAAELDQVVSGYEGRGIVMQLVDFIREELLVSIADAGEATQTAKVEEVTP